jgi:hypothetical protein
MKAEDILKKEEITEEDCGVCKLHEEAYKVLKPICPHCNEHIILDGVLEDTIEVDSISVVGETNGYSTDQNVELMPIRKCTKCNKYIAFKLIPIIYNANHDIYYTGGKDYTVVGEDIKMNDRMKYLIKNYTERLKAGENLDSWNLTYWLEGEMQHQIAEILYKKGLKY